jgi:hypothetical protein
MRETKKAAAILKLSEKRIYPRSSVERPRKFGSL